MLDIVTDKNPSFLPVIIEVMPDWVKAAGVITPEEILEVHPSGFADPIKRLHPIHTKVATFMTAAYLAAHGVADNAPEMQAVKRAADIFGITSEVQQATNALAAQVKSAGARATGPQYALLVKLAADSEEPSGFYPLTSPSQVQDSARALVSDFNAGAGELPLEWFKSACDTVMQAAAHFGMSSGEIHADVREMAADRVTDPSAALDLIEMRKYASGVDADALGIYRDIVKSAGLPDGPSLSEAIGLLETVDRGYGIKYAGVQLNPWRVLHSGPTTGELRKLASNSVILDGVMIPALTFAAIPETQVRMQMAKDAADTVMLAVKSAALHPSEATARLASLTPEVQREVLSLAHQTLSGLPATA